MTSKILKSILSVAVAVLMSSLIIITGVLHNQYTVFFVVVDVRIGDDPKCDIVSDACISCRVAAVLMNSADLMENFSLRIHLQDFVVSVG